MSFLYLYFKGIYIGKVKIKDEKPSENVYVVNCYFKKQIFNNNFVKVVVHPTKFLYANKNQIHYACELEEGVEL